MYLFIKIVLFKKFTTDYYCLAHWLASCLTASSSWLLASSVWGNQEFGRGLMKGLWLSCSWAKWKWRIDQELRYSHIGELRYKRASIKWEGTVLVDWFAMVTELGFELKVCLTKISLFNTEYAIIQDII